MIGIYLNDFESKLLIPLLIQKIGNIYSFPSLYSEEKTKQLAELDVYQEILARIYAALNIGNLSAE